MVLVWQHPQELEYYQLSHYCIFFIFLLFILFPIFIYINRLAVGLSATTAIPISGALNWVIKDGLGQLGGIVFASLVNTHLDEDPKHWRFVTALLLEISTFLEVLSPFFPGYFLLVASLANVGKNVAWLLGGGSRAGIHKSLCKKENLGDITAKCGSQVTFCTLFGTAAGIAVSPFIGGSSLGLFISYGIFASIHLSCIFFAVTDVELNTLNWQRSYFLTSKYINDGVMDIPKVIAHTEHTFFPKVTFKPKLPLTLGYPLNKAFPDPDLFVRRLNLIDNNSEYVISLIKKKNWCTTKEIQSICVLYNNDKTNNKVLLKSYLHGHYIRKLLIKEDGEIDMDKFEKYYSDPEEFDEVIKETFEITCENFDSYYGELVNKGWNTESLFFDNEKYRFTQK